MGVTAILAAMPAAKSRHRAPMSAAHKAALAQGREEGRVVRRYLDLVEEHRPRRGRRRTPESVRRRLAAVEAELPGADTLARLHLLQERADLQGELHRLDGAADVDAAEAAFVAVAAGYGRRKGVGYDAWRAAGVSAAVLARAGITRAPRGPRL